MPALERVVGRKKCGIIDETGTGEAPEGDNSLDTPAAWTVGSARLSPAMGPPTTPRLTFNFGRCPRHSGDLETPTGGPGFECLLSISTWQRSGAAAIQRR